MSWSAAEPIYRTTTASPAASWRARAERYRLTGSRCTKCAAVSFPRRRVCASCRSRELLDVHLARTGTVVSAAEDRTPLIGHSGRSRRPFAIVELDDGPSLLTELVDVRFADVRPGLAVEVVVRKWRREANGLYQYGYKFRPRRQP